MLSRRALQQDEESGRGATGRSRDYAWFAAILLLMILVKAAQLRS